MRSFNVMALLCQNLKKRHAIKFVCAFAIVVLSSCSDMEFNPPTPEVQSGIETPKVSILSRNLIETRYLPTSTPNRYNVQIKWPAYDGTIKFYDEKKVSLNDEPIKSVEYVIQGLEGGVERTFILETQNKDKSSRSQIELTLLPPKDVVISSDLSANEDLNIFAGRIYILDNVTIFTNDRCLSFEFNELIIGNNVKIYNFHPELRAATEKNGRDGGCFKIKGKTAKGFLKIFSTSEHGGDGVLGFPRCLGTHEAECYYDCWGTSGGHAGRRGSFLIDIENSDNFDFDFKILEITGGIRGEKNLSMSRKQRSDTCVAFKGDGRQRYLACDVEPKKGNDATGGKICFKLKTGVDYECIEKN